MTDPIVSKKSPSFGKTPMTYIFMVFGLTIGRYVGMDINATSAGQAAMYVGILSIVFAFYGGCIGYLISSGQ